MACWGPLGGREGKLVNNEILGEFPDGLRMILPKKPDFNIVDRDGNNAIHISCSTNALECMKIWKERDGDFNSLNFFDENGLTVAVQYMALEAVKYLTAHVPVNYRQLNIRGENVVDIAAIGGKEELFEHIVEYLLSKDALDVVVDHLLGKHASDKSVQLIFRHKIDLRRLSEIIAGKATTPNLQVIASHLTIVDSAVAATLVHELLGQCDKEMLLQALINAKAVGPLDTLFKAEGANIPTLLRAKTESILSNLAPEVFKFAPVFNLLLDHFDILEVLRYRNPLKQHIFIILIEAQDNTNSIYHLGKLIEAQGLLPAFDLGALLDERDLYTLSLFDQGFKRKNVLPFTYLNQLAGRAHKFEFKNVKIKVTESRQVSEDELRAVRVQLKPVTGLPQLLSLVDRPEFHTFFDIFNSKNSLMTFNINYHNYGISVIYVNTVPGLRACLDDLRTQPVISLDMETTHTTSRIEILSLIQIATLKSIYVVDAVELFEELRHSLASVFENPAILKLIFSCMSDIKILYFYLQVRLVNFLDICVAYNAFRCLKQGCGLKTVSEEVT